MTTTPRFAPLALPADLTARAANELLFALMRDAASYITQFNRDTANDDDLDYIPAASFIISTIIDQFEELLLCDDNDFTPFRAITNADEFREDCICADFNSPIFDQFPELIDDDADSLNH